MLIYMSIAVTHVLYKLNDSGKTTQFNVSRATKDECFKVSKTFPIPWSWWRISFNDAALCNSDFVLVCFSFDDKFQK